MSSRPAGKFGLTEVIAASATVVASDKRRKSPDNGARVPPSSSPRILIVEDDHQLRELYRAMLTAEGFIVDVVTDGLNALWRLDESTPELVVLDLDLPRLSGHAVHQEIAANPRTRQTSIVVATADPGDLVENDNLCILRKPIDPAVMLATVHRCLRKSAVRSRSASTGRTPLW